MIAILLREREDERLEREKELEEMRELKECIMNHTLKEKKLFDSENESDAYEEYFHPWGNFTPKQFKRYTHKT